MPSNLGYRLDHFQPRMDKINILHPQRGDFAPPQTCVRTRISVPVWLTCLCQHLRLSVGEEPLRPAHDARQGHPSVTFRTMRASLIAADTASDRGSDPAEESPTSYGAR